MEQDKQPEPFAAAHQSALGPTRKSRDVRFHAAVRGIADIKRALIRGSQIYEDAPQNVMTFLRIVPTF
jgi:hypothetical protein